LRIAVQKIKKISNDLLKGKIIERNSRYWYFIESMQYVFKCKIKLGHHFMVQTFC